ncbi:tyrosine-type recombinase/integrase [Streptomyces sp. BHT-5-2]|uniref:tyrosine-type recombinase/integrase n=1 Tax=Streptomyces sp. BHT-5-2 TaxID=2866715 RepID=UPI0028C49781|nr:tyrosine-type recombinase/integrase [Streptomyces sp. BHT-5-2]
MWGSPLRAPKGTTLHDLRHFFASVLIKHGATVKKVQRLLGHAKPSITWDLYVHLWEGDEDTPRTPSTRFWPDVSPRVPYRPISSAYVQINPTRAAPVRRCRPRFFVGGGGNCRKAWARWEGERTAWELRRRAVRFCIVRF